MNLLRQFVRIRGLSGVAILQMIALLLPLVATSVERGVGTIQITIAAIATCLIWENLFAAIRKLPWSFNGITTGIIVSICLPTDTLFSEIIIATTLGIVIGELIFGGRGFGFLNAAVVSLALLLLLSPTAQIATPSISIAIATIPGVILLFLAGLLAWRVATTCLVGFLLLVLVAGSTNSIEPVLIGLIFGVAFLVADPMASSVTKWGQILQGILAAGLLAVFNNQLSQIAPNSIIHAALLASLFAPLIDQIAMKTSNKLRERRYG